MASGAWTHATVPSVGQPQAIDRTYWTQWCLNARVDPLMHGPLQWASSFWFTQMSYPLVEAQKQACAALHTWISGNCMSQEREPMYSIEFFA